MTGDGRKAAGFNAAVAAKMMLLMMPMMLIIILLLLLPPRENGFANLRSFKDYGAKMPRCRSARVACMAARIASAAALLTNLNEREGANVTGSLPHTRA
jgi:hypothetical protein